jgi:hypothetical protein
LALQAAAAPEPQPQQRQADEWEQANQAREAELAQQGAEPPAEGGAPLTAAAAAAQGYAAAQRYFLSVAALPEGIRQQVAAAAPRQPGGWPCFAPRRMGPALQQALRQLQGLARLPFDDGDARHLALLQAVHAAYTGGAAPAPRYGPHWDALGFQGSDPATDLRGCGMLGLLHLLALQQHCPAAAAQAYQLSRHPVQGFPMAIVSINITKWVLTAARDGSLAAAVLGKDECALWRASVAMLAGCWYELHRRWVQGGKTMAESGLVLKQLQAHCLRRVGAMVKRGQAGRQL